MQMRYGVASLVVLALPWYASTVPLPRRFQEQEDRRVVTYRFVARIKSNDGVVPFKMSERVDGQFTYDLEAVPRFPKQRNIMDSPRNSIAFKMGELCFRGTGKVWITVSDFKHAEHFGVGAPDLQLPDGWGMDRTQGSQTYSVLFQNVPAKGVISAIGIPERLTLSSFVNSHELRLDFFHGVIFPGGKVDRRATVFANVETLELVDASPKAEKK